MTEPRLATHFDGSTRVARVSGDCTIDHAGSLSNQLGDICRQARQGRRVVFECAGLGNVDTSGAWLLKRTTDLLERDGIPAQLSGFKAIHFRAMNALPPSDGDTCRPPGFDPLERVDQLGRLTVAGGRHLVEATSFLGHLTVTAARCIINPRRIRLGTMIAAIDRAGVSALPIVVLLAFLISIALSYQGATQLRQFGAAIFTVDLTAVSVPRARLGKVSGSAASVGHLTTVSVVQSLYLVVTADAAISMLYSVMGM